VLCDWRFAFLSARQGKDGFPVVRREKQKVVELRASCARDAEKRCEFGVVLDDAAADLVLKAVGKRREARNARDCDAPGPTCAA
jgi:hypothetical protein